MRRRGTGHRPERRERGLCGRGLGAEGRQPRCARLPRAGRPADVRMTAAGRALVPTGPGPGHPPAPSGPVPSALPAGPCRRLDLLPAVSEREELCFRPSPAPLPSRAAGAEMCFQIEVSCQLPSRAEPGLEPRFSDSVPAPPDGSPLAAVGKLLSSLSEALFSENLEQDSLTEGGGVGRGAA